jgi:hypothetical protein
MELFGWRVQGISTVKQGESKARTLAGIDIAEEDVFEEYVSDGDEQDALWQSQAYILVLLAGRVAESICLGESFDGARFERDSFWEDGKPLPREMLSPDLREHTDRDKAHVIAERMLRKRSALSVSVAHHLRASWDLTERVLTDVWSSVIQLGETLLRAETAEISRPKLTALIRTPAFERLSVHWVSSETSLLGFRREIILEDLPGLLP